MARRSIGHCEITTFAYAAKMALVPKLPAFLLANPDGRGEVNIDDGLTDIVAAGFDAGIRLGETVEKDMIGTKRSPSVM
jgi:DNA-binding transcriptional LysR family regulator